MTILDQQIEAVIAILRANGARVDVERDAPEHVKRAFLEMILKCPESRALLLGRHDRL